VNSGVIDNFLGIFTQYIDSGFGLLGPEVNFLARALVLIDIILAALFWRSRRHCSSACSPT
jgi:type IV secretion system protein TrbL